MILAYEKEYKIECTWENCQFLPALIFLYYGLWEASNTIQRWIGYVKLLLTIILVYIIDNRFIKYQDVKWIVRMGMDRVLLGPIPLIFSQTGKSNKDLWKLE